LFGSFNLNANPIKFETGANVIYLLLTLTFIYFLPFSSIKIPSSILPVASEPLLGPVKPKQGTNSPFANFGK